MPTTYTAYDIYWNNLQLILVGAWPEIDGMLFQDISIERFDWVARLDAGELTVPWCVVVLEEESTDQWGGMPHMIYKPSIYYVTSLEEAKDAGTATATAFIRSKLFALKAAILTNLTIGTPIDVAMDTSAGNPVNVSLLANKNNLQGGSLTLQSVVLRDFTATI